MSWKRFEPFTHLAKYTNFEQLLTKEDRQEIDDLCKKVRVQWTSEEMTPNERTMGAMMGSEIDRVPISMFTQAITMVKKLGGTCRDVYMNPVLYTKAVLTGILEFHLDSGSGPIPVDNNVSDVFGTKWEFPENSMPMVTEWAVKKGFEEILENDLPDPRESEALRWEILTTNFLNEKLGDLSNFSFAFSGGPYYIYCSELRGPREAFYDIKKYPDLATEAFDKLFLFIEDTIKYQMEAMHTPTWTFIDSLSSPSFTPPAWYEKFCAPYQRKIVQTLAPAPGMIAGGGQGQTDFTPLLDGFADMGFVGFSFGPPTDLVKMKKISNEKGLLLAHWAIPAPLLRFGNPQSIEEHVKECIRIGAPGKRYILGSDVPDHDTPPENFLAVKDAVLKYGKYPLKFDE